MKKITPHFYKALSALISSGIPILNALRAIIIETPDKKFKKILMEITYDIKTGLSLSESFKRYPKHFPLLEIEWIKSGENSGTLDSTLLQLFEYKTRISKIQHMLRQALTYPIIVLCVGMTVASGLLIFVIPQFQSLFNTAHKKLPMLTQLVVILSQYFQSHFLLILTVQILFVVINMTAYKYSASYKLLIHKFLLKIPIVGNMAQQNLLAKITYTLGNVINAGIPAPHALRSAAAISGNLYYKISLLKGTLALKQGLPLHAIFQDHALFPPRFKQFVSIGEASGNLSEMLFELTEHYQSQLENSVKHLGQLLEPAIMLILSGLIGTVLIAMYLPIFQMGSVI